MEELLRRLIEEVCQHPDGSQKRRKAMHRLLLEFQHLPGLLKSTHPDYLQALNQTWEWIGRYLCSTFEQRTASLQTSLVRWINGYLYWRIRDLQSSETLTPISLDQTLNDDEAGTFLDRLSENGLSTPIIYGLEGYIEQLQKQKIQRIGLQLENYIQQDPDRKLRDCYPHKYPHCNCQWLSQKRCLQEPPETFEQIAQAANMKLTQVTNHWYGRCQPLLQTIAKDLGYGANE